MVQEQKSPASAICLQSIAGSSPASGGGVPACSSIAPALPFYFLGVICESSAPVITLCLSRTQALHQGPALVTDSKASVEEYTQIRTLFEADDVNGQHFFTIQMPPVLPFWVPDPDEMAKSKSTKEEPAPEVTEIDQRAAKAEKGEISRLAATRGTDWSNQPSSISGMVTMDYDGIRLTLSPGQDVDFLQELVAIDADAKKQAPPNGIEQEHQISTCIFSGNQAAPLRRARRWKSEALSHRTSFRGGNETWIPSVNVIRSNGFKLFAHLVEIAQRSVSDMWEVDDHGTAATIEIGVGTRSPAEHAGVDRPNVWPGEA
ncbi:hypothetical protein BCR37DRAFT_394422 [Protomyces lactucae-debilis]|uniref:Uncharacterized protein n=1 Tax=Protomyces lactucae-debilis TaxID=2754530 RepID=A0A1Y2F5Z6_PROLT|nr:uncharacterized protein BCR37DRAFT_394422 [Protomyces lactucae-debilis]ORY79087.1 hypothetical protein BCR37DRAFT_394422 [Protomyces lactucae-debilis]